VKTNVAILIINWNSSNVLLRCLECIAKQESIKPEVFVLDNSNDDPIAEVYCSRFSSVQFYKSEKYWFCGREQPALSKNRRI